MFTFNDVPGAYRELMGEIDDVKKELKGKGMNVG